jgi:hypothetical protein
VEEATLTSAPVPVAAPTARCLINSGTSQQTVAKIAHRRICISVFRATAAPCAEMAAISLITVQISASNALRRTNSTVLQVVLAKTVLQG